LIKNEIEFKEFEELVLWKVDHPISEIANVSPIDPGRRPPVSVSTRG
jgi:hypothetical protein